MVVVIKTDGYGHGAVPISRMLENVDYVWGYAVATLDEGVVLRKAGIQKPILCLGCIFPDQLEEMIRHMDHLIEHVGVDGVGLGSDFDGATIPAEIGDVAGLPRLVDAMRRHGYDEATQRKLCYENWVNVLERTWGR